MLERSSGVYAHGLRCKQHERNSLAQVLLGLHQDQQLPQKGDTQAFLPIIALHGRKAGEYRDHADCGEFVLPGHNDRSQDDQQISPGAIRQRPYTDEKYESGR